MRLVLAAATRRANREGISVNPVIAVATLAVVAAVALMIRFDSLLLKDLAQTPDDQLQFLTRKGWTVAIVAAFPFGPLIYLTYGKCPRRNR